MPPALVRGERANAVAVLTTLIACLLTVGSSVVAGLAVLRIAGWDGRMWAAGPIGLAALTCASTVAHKVPGRALTVGVVLAVLLLVAVPLLYSRRSDRFRAADLLAVLPICVLAGVPFLVHGSTGILGVSMNNDMLSHLMMSDAYRFESVFDTQGLPAAYPTGPHAFVAVVGAAIGGGTAETFTGVTAAAFILCGASALAFVRNASLAGRSVLATLVGSSYLVAAYFGQGSFKEIMMVTWGLAALSLMLPGRTSRASSIWLPVGVLSAGMVAAYSYNGLIWTAPMLAVWVLGNTAVIWAEGGLTLERLIATVREHAPRLLFAAAVFTVLLVPQTPRVLDYLRTTGGGTSVEGSPTGNLFGPLPFWEGFGVWNSGDYRVVPADAVLAGAWAGFLLALAMMGSIWLIRRGDWLTAAGAAIAAGLWLLLTEWQSPYLAAKGLVILAPFLALLIVLPFVERDGWFGLTSGPVRLVVTAVAVVVGFSMFQSTALALRSSKLGPLDHINELRSFSSKTRGATILFLGNDDFVRWALQDATVRAPFVALPDLPTRSEKGFQDGQPFDIDSIENDAINRADYLITPRDPAASALPTQFRRVASTTSFDLYRRVGRVPRRTILNEGPDSSATFDCSTRAGRRLERSGMAAAIGGRSTTTKVPTLGAGDSKSVRVPLTKGQWTLALQYTSGHRMTVSALGKTWHLPPNLDRFGSRYRLGVVDNSEARGVVVDVSVAGASWLARPSYGFDGNIVATRRTRTVLLPVAEACGKPVDYFVRAND